jgi:hypothetical protein
LNVDVVKVRRAGLFSNRPATRYRTEARYSLTPAAC